MIKSRYSKDDTLIAIFMGWHYDKKHDYFYSPEMMKVKCLREASINLWFSKSWDSLMPVWEEVIKRSEGVFEIGLWNTHSAYWDRNKKFFHYTVGNYLNSPEKVKANSRLEATYLVIVKFIRWYNKQNKK